MQVVDLINQVGPLPIKVAFSVPQDVPVDGPGVLVATGSGWSNTANVLIGFVVTIDDDLVAEATVFSNGPSTHRPMSPRIVATQLSAGPHRCVVAAANADTITDLNDSFAVQVLF